MKKFLIYLTCLAVLLSFISLSACNKGGTDNENANADGGDTVKEYTAQEIIETADQKLNSASSYTAKMDVSSTLNVENVKIDISLSFLTQVSGAGTDEYRYREEQKLNAKSDGGSFMQTIYVGYQDGEIYRRCRDNESNVMIRSSIGKDEFIKYISEGDNVYPELTDILSAHAVITSVKNDNGGWRVTVSNFDEEFLNSYSEQIGFEEMGVDGGVEAISFGFDISSEFMYEKGDIEISLKYGNVISTMTGTLLFENINSTEVKTYSLDSYEKSDDIRLINDAERAVAKLLDRESASFECVTKSELKHSGEYNEASVPSKITYDRTDGLVYKITVDGEEYDTVVDYSDGKVKVSYLYSDGSVYHDTAMESDEATEWEGVKLLIDPASFDINKIKRVTVIDEDTVAFEIVSKELKSIYPPPKNNNFVNYDLESIEVILDFDGDEIVCYSVRIKYAEEVFAGGISKVDYYMVTVSYTHSKG